MSRKHQYFAGAGLQGMKMADFMFSHIDLDGDAEQGSAFKKGVILTLEHLEREGKLSRFKELATWTETMILVGCGEIDPPD